MWKFEFEQPPGARILSGRFFGVCHWNPSNRDMDLWWGEDQRRWAPFDELHNMDVCCTHAPVHSLYGTENLTRLKLYFDGHYLGGYATYDYFVTFYVKKEKFNFRFYN